MIVALDREFVEIREIVYNYGSFCAAIKPISIVSTILIFTRYDREFSISNIEFRSLVGIWNYNFAYQLCFSSARSGDDKYSTLGFIVIINIGSVGFNRFTFIYSGNLNIGLGEILGRSWCGNDIIFY